MWCNRATPPLELRKQVAVSENPANPAPKQTPSEVDARVDAVDARRRDVLRWLWRLPVIAAAATATWAFQHAYRIHFLKGRPSEVPLFNEANAQRIAALSDFPQAWDAVEFHFAERPSIAIRTPEPLPWGLSIGEQHFVAFSRICTHLGCPTVLNRNTEAIAFAFNHRSEHPALVCNCHLSVFSVMQSGRVVSGPAVDPLPRIALQQRSGALYAVGYEQAPSSG